ncbi:hypothetical protein [Winogradskyella ouciana]|uniref:hypothetical protein n=1 Tax=Winogradskyella ouciana TaxID=2608631 RepID=UPI003D27E94A
MIASVYFVLFFVIILAFCIYLIAIGRSTVLSNDYSYPQNNIHFLSRKVQSVSFSRLKLHFEGNQIKGTEVSSFKNETHIELQIKKENRHLKRNLKTLSYINFLEANSDVVHNSKRDEEIKNLKTSVQRQIIKNTDLLNRYRLNS